MLDEDVRILSQNVISHDEDGRSLEGVWKEYEDWGDGKDIGQNSKTTNQPAVSSSTCVVQPWAKVVPQQQPGPGSGHDQHLIQNRPFLVLSLHNSFLDV